MLQDIIHNRTYQILAILVVLVLVYYYFYASNNMGMESFSTNGANELDKYYESPVADIANYAIDNVPCSPLCCGDQWQVPFDGLTSAEIQEALVANGRDDYGRNSGVVRSNYMCGNGDGGVGCPCMGTDAYLFLNNRGNNAPDRLHSVEPTFYVHNDLLQEGDDEDWTPFQKIQKKKSIFVGAPKLNDVSYQRKPQSLAGVQSNGSPVAPKDAQLATVM